MRISERQTLIFDADDTLWENNVIFERVMDEFIEWVAHPSLAPPQVRAIIAEVEEANIRAHGYGSQVFLRSLADSFLRLSQGPIGAAEQARLARFAAAFEAGSLELLPGVAQVLDELGGRHQLLMMTKGAADEQQRKIDASGLAGRFAGIHIVPVKEPAIYLRVVGERGLDPDRTWMIGNSPKSDIIPARAAGLRAVFIPHPYTWAHEEAPLDPADPGILRVAALADLPRHF